jgi:hypothetical protein
MRSVINGPACTAPRPNYHEDRRSENRAVLYADWDRRVAPFAGRSGCPVLLPGFVAERWEPRLVIDPKPYVGDPVYDLLQHMLNCEDRLAAYPAALADRMASLAGVDAGRVRQLLFARSVQESVGSPFMRQVSRRLAPA